MAFFFHLRKGEWVWVDGPSLPARANARLSDRGSRHGNLYSFQKPNETGSDLGVFIRSLMLTFRRKSMKNWWSLLIKPKSLRRQIAPYGRKEQAGDFTGESQWFLASPTCTGTLILARIYVEFDVDQGERCLKIWISSSSTPVNTWDSRPGTLRESALLWCAFWVPIYRKANPFPWACPHTCHRCNLLRLRALCPSSCDCRDLCLNVRTSRHAAASDVAFLEAAGSGLSGLPQQHCFYWWHIITYFFANICHVTA